MDKPYVHTIEHHNLKAPGELVPILLDLARPASVLDVGCGTGTWLKVFEDYGVKDITGVDGAFVDKEMLNITTDKFIERDLRDSWSLGRKYDMVLSLEVAEHLPETSADIFVKCLVEHGDTIVFSAAVPDQGGQNHLNEQWPHYWQLKFGRLGYYFHDVIRPLVWNNPNVDWWYKQNIFLVNRNESTAPVLSYIHPESHQEHLRFLQELNASARGGRLGMLESFRIFARSIAMALERKSTAKGLLRKKNP